MNLEQEVYCFLDNYLLTIIIEAELEIMGVGKEGQKIKSKRGFFRNRELLKFCLVS